MCYDYKPRITLNGIEIKVIVNCYITLPPFGAEPQIKPGQRWSLLLAMMDASFVGFCHLLSMSRDKRRAGNFQFLNDFQKYKRLNYIETVSAIKINGTTEENDLSELPFIKYFV